MYYGKKKGIMIAILLIIVLLVVGATGAYLYLATDLFKSNDEMFYKYMGQVFEDAQYTKNMQLAQVEDLKESNPYTTEGTLTFNIDLENKQSEINKLNNARVDIKTKVDKTEEMEYLKADIYSKQDNIFTLEYANSNNIYALKSDEVVTAFIGVENKDLKSFVGKAFTEIDNTIVPDELEVQNYKELFTLTEQEKQHIVETYMDVIKNNIPKNAFTKENNTAIVRSGVTYNATGYRLNLTANQLKSLEVAVLNELKTDSITLNMITTKAKILGLDERYTNVNEFSKVIDEAIVNITNSNNQINDLSIVVYVQNGEVITTDVIVKNIVKFTFYTNTENTSITRNLLISNLGLEEEFGTIDINVLESRTTSQTSTYTTINVDDTKKFTLYIGNTGSASEGYLNTEIEASYEEENNIYNASYKQKLQFVDELENMILLSRANCGVLNDYSKEELSTLLGQIGQRVSVLIEEKAKILGLEFKDDNVEPTINELMKEQDIANFNSKYESYKGEITGSSLKSLNTEINKLNKEESSRKVILTIDGVNVSGANTNSIKTADTYTIDMQYDEEGYINQINAKLKVQ